MVTIDFDFENVGGLNQCYAIPAAAFKGTRVNLINNTHQLKTMLSNTEIIAIPMYADDTFSFTEEDEEEDGNKFWNPVIEGIIPKFGLNNDTIEKLARGEWIVLHEDNNGVVRLSGTEEIPLRCTTLPATGRAFADRSETVFRFTASEQQPSVIMESLDLDYYQN